MKKISYSSWELYLSCAKMYEIEKILGYRPKQKSSALVFGSAFDEAINILNKKGDIDKAKEVFKAGLRPLIKTTKYYFFKADFDYDLLTDTQIEIANKYLKELEYEGNLDIDMIHKQLFTKIVDNGNNYSVLSENQQLLISLISTMSLKQKGLLMFDTYIKDILPKIKKVHSIQRKITHRPGILDLEADYEDQGKITFDIKTSAKLYSDSKIYNAPQLLIYDLETKNNKIGYIVFVKQIKKNTTKHCKICKFNGTGKKHKTCFNEIQGVRCGGEWDIYINPEAIIQVLIGDVDKDLQKTVIGSMTEVENAIEKGVFPRNLNTCPNHFGKPCSYIEYCHKGSAKNLIKIQPKGDKK